MRVDAAAALLRRSGLAPALRMLPLALGIVAALVLVDSFRTSADLGRWRATLFWSALVGLNVAAWKVWRHVVGDGATRGTRLLLGAVLLNGMLSLEVPALYRAMGRAGATVDWRTFAYGLLATLLVAHAKSLRRRRDPLPAPRPTSLEPGPSTTPMRALDVGRLPPLLARAGLSDVSGLVAIRAEDHYCRLLLADGSSRLVHYRFGDVLIDLAGIDGARVHRGTWVADGAVIGGRREGRRWSLELVDGTVVPVSETSVALCRERGWLRGPASSAHRGTGFTQNGDRSA